MAGILQHLPCTHQKQEWWCRSLHLAQPRLLQNIFALLVLLLIVVRLVLRSEEAATSRVGQLMMLARVWELTYFHPMIRPHLTQKMSRTVCNPVAIRRSSGSPSRTLTLS